jgi:hypothetical protein
MRRVAMCVAVLAVLAVSTAGTAGAADTFSVQGNLDGLYPGFDGTLPTQVVNTLDVAIHVERVSASAATSDVVGCDPSVLHLTAMDPALDLAPGETGVVPLRTRMSMAAPDACQGAAFTVVFRARALAQDRPPSALAFTGTSTAVLVAAGWLLLLFGIACLMRARRSVRP